jgi:hypothetical protein
MSHHIKIQPYDNVVFANANFIEILYVNPDYSVDYSSRVIRKTEILRIQEDRDQTRVDIYFQDGGEIEIEFDINNVIYGYAQVANNDEFYNNLLDAIFGTRAILP